MSPLDEAELAATTKNLHVDLVEDGAPLVITFGFYAATGPAEFEFLGRLRELERVSGRAINKLLVRDPSMRWYLGGIDGIGHDVASTVAGLREQVDGLRPSAVITVGQSMGAYGAILYGALLGADKVVSFGSLSCFDRRLWSIIDDNRWAPVLEALERSALDLADHADLPSMLARQTGPQPDIDLLFGLSPGAGAEAGAAIGHDGAHALRFAAQPGVTILPVLHSQHPVVEHFRSHGVLTAVLDQRIFGTSLVPTIQGLRGDSWGDWLLENLALGSNIATLVPVMQQHGLAPEQVQSCVDRAHLLDDLARLEAHPPVFTA